MSKRDDPTYFSPEYHNRFKHWTWQPLRRFCFLLTWGRDAIFPWARAQELDHLHYRSLYREIPLIDVMPLSKINHLAITALRDNGWRGPVNFAMRCAGLVWLTLDTIVLLTCTGHFSMVTGGYAWATHLPTAVHADVQQGLTWFTHA